MELIQNNVYTFGFLVALLGLLYSGGKLLSKLSDLKGRVVSPKWFMYNRPYKFASAIIATILGCIFIIIGFDPGTTDPSKLPPVVTLLNTFVGMEIQSITPGVRLFGYMAGMSMAAPIAIKVMDLVGSKTHVATETVKENGVVESCKTLFKTKLK